MKLAIIPARGGSKRIPHAGQFYWGRAQAFMDEVVAFSPASLPVILPRHLVQDIDTLEDWRRAELMYQAWRLERGEG